jgi:hypothetical protein
LSSSAQNSEGGGDGGGGGSCADPYQEFIIKRKILMLSLNPLKEVQKNHKKVLGTKLLHIVIKVNSSIFLSFFR